MNKPTPQQLNILLTRIYNDPLFLFENFFKIVDKSGNLVPFILNKPQMRTYNIFMSQWQKQGYINAIILKARQEGMSTLTEAFIAWRTLFHRNTSSLIIAHEQKSATHLLGMCTRFWENLPKWLQPLRRRENVKELQLSTPPRRNSDVEYDALSLNSHIITAVATNEHSGHSHTFQCVHLSEVSRWKCSPQELMKGVLNAFPTGKPGTILVYESTANGTGNYFHERWKAAVDDKIETEPIFIPWTELDEYTLAFDSPTSTRYKSEKELVDDLEAEELRMVDEHSISMKQMNWRAHVLMNNCAGSLEDFKEQYPLTPEEAFLSSGRLLFNIKRILAYEEIVAHTAAISAELDITELQENIERTRKVTTGDAPVLLETRHGNLTLWETPSTRFSYAIGADTGSGTQSGSRSVAAVFNAVTGDQCALYVCTHNVNDFSTILYVLGRWYHDAFLVPEVNYLGRTTVDRLDSFWYPDVYYRTNTDKAYAMAANPEAARVFGFDTNRISRPILLDKLRLAFERGDIGIRSQYFLEECKTFIALGDADGQIKWGPAKGFYSDAIFAVALAWHGVEKMRAERVVAMPEEKGIMVGSTMIPITQGDLDRKENYVRSKRGIKELPTVHNPAGAM